MEYYEIFMKVILKEVSKFNLNIDVYSTHVAQLTAALDENFDIPYNRCAYMYRYGTVLTHFFNDCINIFFTSYSHKKDIFSMWKSYPEVKVCSLSTGPGLDFVGLMLAALENDSLPPNFEVIVLSKHGAWRNTRNLILEVFNDPVSGNEFSKKPLQYQNLNVVQSDFLQNYSLLNVQAASEANVILMMKTLNLLAPGAPEEGRLLLMFKEFFASLKPETIIFCLDTKPSMAVITQAILNCPGKFLYGPNLHTAQLPATFPEFNGRHPTLSARGLFFVWQKSPNSLSSNVTAINTSIGMSKDNMIRVDNSFNKSNASSVEYVSNIGVKDSDNINLPWVELKSFWQSSSPKTKEVLKKLMLTEDDSLEQINKFMSQKADTSEENSSLSKSNQKNTYNLTDIHSYINGISSPSLNGVSSVTFENSSSLNFLSPSDLDKLPFESDCFELDEKKSKKTDSEKIGPMETCKAFLSLENKTIQTDSLDNGTSPSSIKALTNRIRQLAISLDSASQQNEPSNSSVANFSPFNQNKERAGNDTHSTDKPSCSKQSPNRVFEEQDSLPSNHSCRNAPCQNVGSHYSSHCFHNNICMNCCFQPCCTQSVPRCSFSCHHQSGERNLMNVASPNIVIPLQNISDVALLQIISILKSESLT